VEVKGKGLLQTFWVKQKESQRNFSGNEDTLEMTLNELNKANEVWTSSQEVDTRGAVGGSSPNGLSKKKEARWAKKYPKKTAEIKKTEGKSSVTHRSQRREELSESTFEQSVDKKKFWEK
jgi:hypothetical protein